MKKIFLFQAHQGNTVFYTGRCDPRILVEICADTNEGDREKFQRILDPKRVEEISSYVGEDESDVGILPTTLVLGTRDRERVPIQRDETVPHLYYIEVPDCKEEFEAYRDVLDVMDGQHRLFSFWEGSCKLSERICYEITFNLFETPTLTEKRKIFKTTNEKQKPVNSNLLMWFRDKLQMLSNYERIYHPVVSLLNSEPSSPLYQRIIMGDEKLPKGYKARQLIVIMDKMKLKNLKIRERDITTEEMFLVVSTYLRGWEDVCGCKFKEPETGETSTKISGLRYILLMLPVIWEYSLSSNQKFKEPFVREVLLTLRECLQLEELREVFTDENWSYAFRGEGATVKLASEHGDMLKTRLQDEMVRNFNPLN